MKRPVPCMKVSVHLASSGSPEKAAATIAATGAANSQGEAPKGEEDEQAESDQDSEQFNDMCTHDTPPRKAEARQQVVNICLQLPQA